MGLVYLSTLKKNKLYRNRTISFESTDTTPFKIRGNMVFIMTENAQDIPTVINSNLFKKTLIRSVYCPRIIRPLEKRTVRTDQKNIYNNIKADTHVSISRVTLDQYKAHNVFYDITEEYSAVQSVLLKKSVARAQALCNALVNIVDSAVEEGSSAYKKHMLVFPITKPLPNVRSMFMTAYTDPSPLTVLFMGLTKGWITFDFFKKFDVVFYAPSCDVMYSMDTSVNSYDEIRSMLIVMLNRISRFISGAEDPAVLDAEAEADMTPEERVASEVVDKADKVKTKIIDLYKKKLKIDAADLRDMSEHEKDILLGIEDKIDKAIDSTEDKSTLSLAGLQAEIENDVNIKKKMISYTDIKKTAAQSVANIEKHLDDEFAVLNSGEYIELEDTSDIIKPDEFDIPELDPRMKKNSFNAIDREYTKKLSSKDRKEIFSAMSLNQEAPLVLNAMEVKDTSDDYTKKDTIRCTYTDSKGKPMNVEVDVPKLLDDKYIYSGGTKMLINRQLVRLPIVKTKNNRVEITTNYNKMTMERTNGSIFRENAYLFKILADEKFQGVEIEFGGSEINDRYISDFMYEEIASRIRTITSDDYSLTFNRDRISDIIKNNYSVGFEKYATSHNVTPVGFENSTGKIVVIDNNTHKIVLKSETEPDETLGDNIYRFILDKVLKRNPNKPLPKIGKNYIYTKTHFLGQGFPTFVMLGMVYGIETVLTAAGVKYSLVEEANMSDDRHTYIKFSDCYMKYENRIDVALLLNVLASIPTEDYTFMDFDTKRPYMNWLMDKMGSSEQTYTMMKYNLEAMIDPITYQVLIDLKQPTTILEVLIYANSLLVSNEHSKLNDFRNFRLRRGEIVNAILSKKVSDAYVTYQRMIANGSNKAKLEIDRASVIKALVSAPNVTPHSVLNPSLEIESLATVSHKGPSGINLGAAYTLGVRAYDEQSMLGFVGNGTPFSGDAGINRYMSLNPKVSSARGYIPTVDHTQLNAANIYSPTELLNAYNRHSDPVRSAMTVGQSKHVVAVRDSDAPLISSGYNRIIPHMLSDDFVFKAKENGIVESIDEENEIAVLLYANKERDAVNLGGVTAKNSSMGFYQYNKLEMKYSVGESFNKGDVIACNPAFFTGKGKNVSLTFGSLCKIALCPNDACYQDASFICETVSNKCSCKVTMQKQIALGVNAVVHNMVKVGDTVKTGDPLITFTKSYNDPNTIDFMKNLIADGEDDISTETVDSKVSGKIVDIKVYYNQDMDKLSDSLKGVISNYKQRVDKRRAVIQNIPAALNSNTSILPVEKSDISKLNGKKFEGVLIEFYIEFVDKMTYGDKGTASIALKFTVSKIVPVEEAPYSEYDPEEPIEIIVSPTSLISRMVPDLVLQSNINKVLINLKRQIGKIYNIRVPKPYESGLK